MHLNVSPDRRSRICPSVRFTVGSNGRKSSCSTCSSDFKSAAVSVSVSSASRGGSFHLAAMAAYRSRLYCVSPRLYTGASGWITILFSVSVPVLSLGGEEMWVGGEGRVRRGINRGGQDMSVTAPAQDGRNNRG